MISHRIDGRLSVLTLNRPDKANALIEQMLSDLAEGVEASGDTDVLILTGTGGVFSAGADLEAAKQGLAVSPVWERLSGAIRAYPGLSIAALNGTVAGGAMGMVLACDLRIAMPGAKVFYPVMKLGFLPQPSDPDRLAALVGPSRARMILMAGQKIGAEEALTWGLFDRLHDGPDVMDGALALAEAALSAKPGHCRAIGALFSA